MEMPVVVVEAAEDDGPYAYVSTLQDWLGPLRKSFQAQPSPLNQIFIPSSIHPSIH
jgi:hypothetical protein